MSNNEIFINEWKFTEKRVNEAIKKTIDATAKTVVDTLKNSNMIKNEISYYKRVEILLYNYGNLKDAVKQKQEDIDYIDKEGLPGKSTSVVVYTSGGKMNAGDRYLELKESYQRAIEETTRDIKRIENAIDKIREDKYFKIISFKYLNKEDERVGTDEAIAEKLGKDRKTIVRNRKRLINKLVTIFFPESIREVM